MSLSKADNRVNYLDRFQELDVLVSALTLDSEPQRRTVANGKILTIETIGENCLWVNNLEDIDTLVPALNQEGISWSLLKRQCGTTT